MATSASKVLVVGSGTIGLRTAVELVRRNVPVVLQSPRHPLDPSTCSQGAGGLWMPFHCDDARTNRWAMETLDELMPFANNPECNLVEILPAIVLHREHKGPAMEDFTKNKYDSALGGTTKTSALPEWTRDPRIQFQHLTVEMLAWQNIVYKLKIPPEKELKEAGYLHAWLFRPPIVDCPNMLESMLEEVRQTADMNLETGHDFESMEHIRDTAKTLGCDAIVNCTGLGAAKLCDDNELIGARGIVLNFDRKKCKRRLPVQVRSFEGNKHDAVIMTDEEPWGSETFPAYLIPRGDVIVLGGSYLEGDTEVSIRDDERERLLRNATHLGIDTDQSPIVSEWTGFRPYRPTARCELDPDMSDGLRVVHNYGYGGSGWTVNVGAAKEATDLLLGAN